MSLTSDHHNDCLPRLQTGSIMFRELTSHLIRMTPLESSQVRAIELLSTTDPPWLDWPPAIASIHPSALSIPIYLTLPVADENSLRVL